MMLQKESQKWLKNSELNVTKKEDRTDRMEENLGVIYELIKQKEFATSGHIKLFKCELSKRYQNDMKMG